MLLRLFICPDAPSVAYERYGFDYSVGFSVAIAGTVTINSDLFLEFNGLLDTKANSRFFF